MRRCSLTLLLLTLAAPLLTAAEEGAEEQPTPPPAAEAAPAEADTAGAVEVTDGEGDAAAEAPAAANETEPEVQADAAGDGSVPVEDATALRDQLSYVIGYQRLAGSIAQMGLQASEVVLGLQDGIADEQNVLGVDPEQMQDEFQAWQAAKRAGTTPEPAGASPEEWNTDQRVSYLFGFMPVTRTVKAAEFDPELVARGLLDASADEEPAFTSEDLEADLAEWDRILAERQAARAEVNAAEASEYLAEKTLEPGIESTESGLLYEVLEEGAEDGVSPDRDDRVTAHYTGRLLDGTVFDSSEERGEPATFALDEVIPGWTEGLQLMRTGARYRFHIPPELAYGREGRPGTIPPNAVLIFEVELLEVEEVLGDAEYLAVVAEREGVEATGSGLLYEVLEEGEGPTPAATDTVRVHYTGRLVDGTVFDSSEERGQPISFALNQVIPGWTEGLQLMPVGSRYRLHIPSDLGYGQRGSPPTIPGGATLVFEVELLGIE